VRAGDVLGLAAESLRLHRLRTSLTLLAVAIGATAVLLLTALGDAAKGYVIDQFSAMGTNLINVAPGRTETTGMGGMPMGSNRDLTIEDGEAIRRQCPAVADLAPVALASAPVEYGDRGRDAYVVGTTPAYAEIRGLQIAAGRFLPAVDPRRGEGVVVIGQKLKRELFGDENAVGRAVRIARARFRVIGVLAPKGMALGVDFDEMAIVPVSTGLRLFDRTSLTWMVVRARDAGSLVEARDQIRAVLVERHREEDFSMVTMDAMLASFRAIIDALTVALAGIAAISLAVAGIGIMNVMLVAVSERVGEVGLLKALGGRRSQIAALFLAEALLLSGAGAIAGIAVGLAGVRVAERLWPVLPLHPNPMWIGVILALSLVAGGAFGLMPARRAAALAAAEALRKSR
jgi:putative ABC transport system permease protein